MGRLLHRSAVSTARSYLIPVPKGTYSYIAVLASTAIRRHGARTLGHGSPNADCIRFLRLSRRPKAPAYIPTCTLADRSIEDCEC